MQVTAHEPFEHAWPMGQAMPQLPQLAESLRVLTHELPHSVVPEH
jgi:hypothetical protein